MTALIEQLKSDWDFVLVDAPRCRPWMTASR